MRPRDLQRYLKDVGWPRSPEPPRPSPNGAVTSETRSDESIDALAKSADGCTLCRLSEKRQTVVFGEGHPQAPVLFVGEGPGAEEDRTGRPFVGQAGQLLDQMIFAMGFERREVYIANVVKCRPPGNRDPREDEMAACAPYLERRGIPLMPVFHPAYLLRNPAAKPQVWKDLKLILRRLRSTAEE